MKTLRKLNRRWDIIALASFVPLLVIGYIFTGISIALRSHDKAEHVVSTSFDISQVGHKLVFNAKGQGSSNLYLLNLQTWKVTRLTDTPNTELYPVFTSDGQSVVYTESKPGHDESWIMSLALATGKTRRLTFPVSPYSDRMPACSRDGTHIAFSRAALTPVYGFGGAGTNGWDLYTMKIDGSDIRRVTSTRYYNLSAPVYNVNDRTLFFCAIPFDDSEVTGHLFSVSADGSGTPAMLDPANSARKRASIPPESAQ